MAQNVRNVVVDSAMALAGTTVGVFADQSISPSNLAQDTTAQRVANIAILGAMDAVLIAALHDYLDPVPATLATTFFLLPQAQIAQLAALLYNSGGSFSDTSKL